MMRVMSPDPMLLCEAVRIYLTAYRGVAAMVLTACPSVVTLNLRQRTGRAQA